jgi:tRNA threonylcarbamoyladenosine biosynthesis protein TsaB
MAGFESVKKNNVSSPLILALETSGRTGSVAIAAGSELLAETRFSALMRHSAEVFPAIQSLLERFGKKPCDVEQVYLSIGPGSFTGLRIALTIAKTMNLAVGSKIVALDTLDVIAANAEDYIAKNPADIRKIGVILDAKRGQFFAAAYRKNHEKWEKILPACLITAGEFLEKLAVDNEPTWLLGEGLVYYKDRFTTTGIEIFPPEIWTPTAGRVHQLGWLLARAGLFADPLMVTPAYLRGHEAVPPTR